MGGRLLRYASFSSRLRCSSIGHSCFIFHDINYSEVLILPRSQAVLRCFVQGDPLWKEFQHYDEAFLASAPEIPLRRGHRRRFAIPTRRHVQLLERMAAHGYPVRPHVLRRHSDDDQESRVAEEAPFSQGRTD